MHDRPTDAELTQLTTPLVQTSFVSVEYGSVDGNLGFILVFFVFVVDLTVFSDSHWNVVTFDAWHRLPSRAWHIVKGFGVPSLFLWESFDCSTFRNASSGTNEDIPSSRA